MLLSKNHTAYVWLGWGEILTKMPPGNFSYNVYKEGKIQSPLEESRKVSLNKTCKLRQEEY